VVAELGIPSIVIKILTALYSFCGIAGFVGYVPQIWRLWKDDTRAASTSLLTWGWWTFAGTVAFVYALFVNKDPAFVLVASSNFFGCWAVYGLAVWRRYGPTVVLK